MRVLVVDKDGFKESEINNFKDYYPLLDCRSFDMVRVRWAGSDIIIFVDDEGLFVKNTIFRKVSGYPNPLAGNLVIAGGVDNEGNTLPCPDWLTIDNLDCFIEIIEG